MDENNVVTGNGTNGSEPVNNTQADTKGATNVKKDGWFKRQWKKVKKHKDVIIAGVSGMAIGVGASLGASEIGKRSAEKKAAKAVSQQEDHSPLDPNY